MKFYAPSAAQLLGRILLSAIFIMGGLHKIQAPGPTIDYIAAGGLPFPTLAYGVSVLVEFGGGLAILLGFQTRFVGLVLAGFCVVTGVVFHFHPENPGQMINYWKNICMAGGFLQLFALGGGAFTVDALLRRKFIAG
jgi:putative oxidoreductase